MATKVVVTSNSYEVEAEAPPTAKPPSMYHNYSGSVRSQDIFVEQIEAHRKEGQKYKMLFPGSDEFELERFDTYNYDSICVPCLILQPRTSADVASCVRGYSAGVRRCLSENKRTGSNLGIPRLCVAGGRMSMASMKEGAIVLDLSQMRGVKVDKEAETVLVQAGARIQDVDRITGEFGLMCVTGGCQYLGVIGCLLAGGYGYASRKYGLSCDNVLAAQVVLGDGTVRRCSPMNRTDLFWSLCGGGGGIAVVTSITLRCYPVVNAALVTCNLAGSGSKGRQSAVKEWAEWINGGNGAPQDVFSQLILPTKSCPLPCIATSIDTEAIPQSEAYLELYRDMERTNNKRPGILGRKQSNSDRLPVSWDRVPGLCDLKTGKIKSRVRNGTFSMLPYGELQKKNDDFYKPGNLFVSYKYASALTDKIVEVLTKATSGSKAANTESQVIISSLGGAVNEIPADQVAFGSRGINFVIYIEGKWHASNNEQRDQKEKEKVIKWVHFVVNSLNMCEGIRSTAYPESFRDQVSKSGKKAPGWYNIDKANGKKLTEIKRAYDRRNVFSLASRVSWFDGASNHESPGDRYGSEEQISSTASFSSDEDRGETLYTDDDDRIVESGSSKAGGRRGPRESDGEVDDWDGIYMKAENRPNSSNGSIL